MLDTGSSSSSLLFLTLNQQYCTFDSQYLDVCNLHCCIQLSEWKHYTRCCRAIDEYAKRQPSPLNTNDIKEAGWRQQVSKHAHTDTHAHTHHIVYCTLLSPMRVMILLYLHGFSYIDLDQDEAPPAGAPFLGSPPSSYCAHVCMCAKYQ